MFTIIITLAVLQISSLHSAIIAPDHSCIMLVKLMSYNSRIIFNKIATYYLLIYVSTLHSSLLIVSAYNIVNKQM